MRKRCTLWELFGRLSRKTPKAEKEKEPNSPIHLRGRGYVAECFAIFLRLVPDFEIYHETYQLTWPSSMDTLEQG